MSYNVHDYLKGMSVEELQVLSARDRIGFSIMLMNFEHDLNIGNCIRSAHLLGVNTVIIFGKNKIDSRSTVGAHNYLNLVKVAVDLDKEDVVDAFKQILMRLKMKPIYIDKTPGSEDIESQNFKTTLLNNYGMQPCLIFGNEATGIHPAIKATPCYHIKQYGVIRSFNVASAASIAMYKACQIIEGSKK